MGLPSRVHGSRLLQTDPPVRDCQPWCHVACEAAWKAGGPCGPRNHGKPSRTSWSSSLLRSSSARLATDLAMPNRVPAADEDHRHCIGADLRGHRRNRWVPRRSIPPLDSLSAGALWSRRSCGSVAAETWSLVLIPLWVQLSLALVFGAIALILLWRAAPSTAGGGTVQDQDDDARRMLAVAEGIALLAVVWIAFQGLGAVELVRLWDRGWGGFRPYLPDRSARGDCRVRRYRPPLLRRNRRVPKRIVDEGPFWRLKVLYVNPADPSLFVPGRWGGLTLNFGRPTAVAFMRSCLVLGSACPS